MIKRYRLKKDLPQCKAGEVLTLSGSGNLGKKGKVKGDFVLVLDHNTITRNPGILNNSKWFEEIPEKQKTVWDLKEGDKYWGIELSNLTGFSVGEYEFNLRARHYREVGDVFLTEEDAEKELARRKAKVILERDTKGFKPNIDNLNQKRYYVSYDPTRKKLWSDYEDFDSVSRLIVFKSLEDAEASIKTHEKEWKTYLGVEE